MKTTHNSAKRRLTAAALILVFLSLFTLPAFAKSERPTPRVDNITVTAYSAVPIYYQGNRLSVDARLINGTTYVPIRAFATAVCNCTVSWNAKTRTAMLTADGLYLIASDKGTYLTANGRYLFNENPAVILSNGTLYVPVRPLAKALGVGIEWNAANRSVTVTGTYEPILSGDKFYDADSVYWLSRIISAESQGEPLLGQIAVGNVVLNRVESDEYPNTIYGVIFDRKYGTQFTPAAIGTVYEKPFWLSVVAAKICLEGTSLDDRVLYFYEPALSTSNWIGQNRPYAFTIGCHQFYY